MDPEAALLVGFDHDVHVALQDIAAVLEILDLRDTDVGAEKRLEARGGSSRGRGEGQHHRDSGGQPQAGGRPH